MVLFPSRIGPGEKKLDFEINQKINFFFSLSRGNNDYVAIGMGGRHLFLINQSPPVIDFVDTVSA